ncbi:unnamed protein product [Cylindrotheca closterium]|uniref:Uncharacterized protein n=1 Tax=Cylindrotheca closterium TaxID=2856 RepID=A0AAD2CQ90_9STRA|nr:unnamed protein product [Cylindrotheca closterium]
MKLINSSSSTKRNCFVSFLLLCLFELTSASTSSLTTTVDGNQIARRAKRGANNNYTTKSKCVEKTTPMDDGGNKVTTKCVHQVVFDNDDIDTMSPTWNPSATPSTLPTNSPTSATSSAPTLGPTSGPTSAPSGTPTWGPTSGPTTGPTSGPTSGPSIEPTSTGVLVSTLPAVEGRGTKVSSTKAAIGALVGGILGFAVLAVGAKAVETAWNRRSTSDDSSIMALGDEEQAS